MRVIRPARQAPLFSPRGATDPLLAATSGLGLVVAAIGIAYLTVGTHLVDRLAATAAGATIVAALLAWTFAVIAPAVFGMLGAARLLGSASAVRDRVHVGPAARMASRLSDAYLVAGPLTLPDGRTVSELVLGPHGIVVVGEPAHRSASRFIHGTWEVRGRTGGWRAAENPIDRAARDAERVRRWLAEAGGDSIIRVYAAVVTDDPSVRRTDACAVIAADRIPAFLDALPAQRTLTPARTARLERLIREAAAG